MTPYYTDPWLTVYHGDSRAVMAEMEPESVHCVVTSPPYWGLRDYGTASWEGGDEGCDHSRPVRRYNEGCVGCGVPMQEKTPGCGNCAARHSMRKAHGTPLDRNYDAPPEDHWEKPRSRDQVTDATVPYRNACAKCGATRVDAQLGLEPTPEAYVESMVAVFREVRRVLRSDGTVWLNLGDSYASGEVGRHDGRVEGSEYGARHPGPRQQARLRSGLKPKDLVGIPWRVAFALQADGWYLRSDIIWAKPNPMPESVTDRPTKSHEYLFLLSKSPRYYYDADAVREDFADERMGNPGSAGVRKYAPGDRQDIGRPMAWDRGPERGGRNLRSVWTVATQPYPGAHFATFPPKLIEPCIKAGCPEGGVVLDCFAGSGTTGLVAQRLSRRAVLIDLSMDYLGQLMDRNRDIPMGLVS